MRRSNDSLDSSKISAPDNDTFYTTIKNLNNSMRLLLFQYYSKVNFYLNGYCNCLRTSNVINRAKIASEHPFRTFSGLTPVRDTS